MSAKYTQLSFLSRVPVPVRARTLTVAVLCSIMLLAVKGSSESDGMSSPLTFNEIKEGLENSFKCPITKEYMINPVITADGQTYERAAIERWFASDGRAIISPLTGAQLPHRNLIREHALRNAIEEYIKTVPEKERPAHKLQVGYKILSHFRTNGAKSNSKDQGTVTAVNDDNTINITFDDGTKQRIPGDWVLEVLGPAPVQEYRPGDRVEAYYAKDREWYPATYHGKSDRNGFDHIIVYDDTPNLKIPKEETHVRRPGSLPVPARARRAGPGVQMTGAGDARVNGWYARKEAAQGPPRGWCSGFSPAGEVWSDLTGQTLYNEGRWYENDYGCFLYRSGGHWRIHIPDGSLPYFCPVPADQDGAAPPAEGWGVRPWADAPAPTLRVVNH